MRVPSLKVLVLLLACCAGAATRAAAQGAHDTHLESALLELLREKGVLTEAECQQLLAIAKERARAEGREVELIESSLQRLAAPDVGVRGGTAGKLLFRSADGKWTMGLRGRMQMRVSSQSDDAPNIDSNADLDTEGGVNFSVPRVRFGVAGNAGAENVKYNLEWDMGTTSTLNAAAAQAGARAFNLRAAYVDWGFANGTTLRFGQAKFPFGREEQISGFGISLMERSLASNNFTPSWEPLAMLSGTLGGGALDWSAAVSNGDGQSINNNDGDAENGLRQGVRLVWNAVGEPIKTDGPSFQTLAAGDTRAAFGASWMKNDNSVDKNTKAPITAAGGKSVRDSESLGLDFQLMSGPWSFMAEWFERKEDRIGLAGQRDDGTTLQLGYFLVPNAWELVARVSRLSPSGNAAAPTAGVLANTQAREVTLGLNRYLDGHNSKWMFDVVRTDFHHVVGVPLGEDVDTTQYRIQYQAIF
ncbi:MAG: porin [Planctomycetota bacterium]